MKVQYIRSPLGTNRQSNYVDSSARQSSLKCVDGDNVIIISDDAEDVDCHLAAWQCTTCSSANPGSVAQCISCLALQTPDSLLVDDANKGVEKLSGTEVGKDDGNVDAMDCDGDDEMWVCCRCTLQNVAESSRCELCEAPRRSIGFRSHTMDSVNGQHLKRDDLLGTDNSNVRNYRSGLGMDESDNATPHCVDMQNTDSAVWTCSSCTYNNNPSWAKFCDVCETVKQVYSSPQKQTVIGKAIDEVIGKVKVSQHKEKVATSWQCTKCTTVNANSVRDCNCCGSLRMMADADSVQNTWTCTKCTLQNNNVAHVCAACLSKRNTCLPQVDDIDMKWPCPKCTCINYSSQNLCQACEYDRLTPHNNRNDYQVPEKAASSSTQQKSVFVKEQQIKEEMAAHDQWIQIINFCKVVSYLSYYHQHRHPHRKPLAFLPLEFDISITVTITARISIAPLTALDGSTSQAE